MKTGMNTEYTLTDLLEADSIKYRGYSGPKGLTFEIDIDFEGRTYVARIFCERIPDSIQSYQLKSLLPVDPECYYEVERILGYLNSRQRLFKWRLLEDGHYVIEPANSPYWGHNKSEIPVKVRKMVKYFSTGERFIEEIARGKRDYQFIRQQLENGNEY